MSTEWIKNKREQWPTGSLERVLENNYSGSTSLSDAVSKQRTQKQNDTATQTPSDYEAMKQIIDELTVATKDFDFDKLPFKVRETLANMPLKTIEEALLWKQAWAEVLGGAVVGETNSGAPSLGPPKNDQSDIRQTLDQQIQGIGKVEEIDW